MIAFLGIGFSVNSQTAHAVRYSWRNSHWVTITKDVTVLKIRTVYPRSSSYSVDSYTAQRGEHYKLAHWGVDFSWVLQSGKFRGNSKYIYVVDASENGGWFKMGIHHLKNYKLLHGFRMAINDDYSFNTNYDTNSHTTFSLRRPTQKSKVMFEPRTHAIPTHHKWTVYKEHNDAEVDYQYYNGSWHKVASRKATIWY
ncbi:hypothetical protein [Secundilactobacillus silagei]|nr:hypothetical protein [Secundilactobacillus silagei]